MIPRSRRRDVALFLVVLVVLTVVPGGVVARTGTGGTVVVAEGETVDGIEAAAGSVVIRGTVTGDVSGLAGSIEVAETGTVEGDLEAAAGEVTIGGTVRGDVSTGAGTVTITERGTVGGSLMAGAGLVVIDGRVVGDARVGADTIRLGPNAAIEGSLRYDGDVVGNREAVAGTITEDPSITFGVGDALQPLATWVFSLYAFVSSLLLGAILLALFPGFAGGVTDRVREQPVRTGAIGFAVLLGIPILLIGLALTVVGIPFTLVGFLLFAFVAWVGLIYGRFAVGAWLLSYVDVDNRWMALVVGMVVGAALGWIPLLGGLLGFLIFLLGLGALVRGLYHHRRRQSPRTGSATTADRTAAD
ncbi:bactofilin family protein [Halobacteriales archaeon Cl-PHB]